VMTHEPAELPSFASLGAIEIVSIVGDGTTNPAKVARSA